MNSTRRSRKRAAAIAGSGLAALVGTAVMASPASAHVPQWTYTCDSVHVHLQSYDAHAHNTVEVTADGKDLLPATAFKSDFADTLTLAAHSSPVALKLIVRASDDPTGAKGWSVEKTATAPVCQSGSPTPPPPSSSPTPPPSASGTPTPSAGTSAPVAVPSPSSTSPGLAETGASSTTPVVAGIGAAVVLAGGALLVVGRRRRAGSR
ncbi:LAETG motif-containing sortase-dependent surface protein [Streptantibioticus parmotrematis]|uniref:LAETG motif-containing sortase-dependent surface protein n=1 Tax=Streptantibioticus parmotrematis TaxID=2873249 RepID=UPI0033FBD57A